MAPTAITGDPSQTNPRPTMPGFVPPGFPAGDGDAGATQALAKKLVGDLERYRHLVSGRGGKSNAQILDLNPLRTALGASWPSYSELIHRIAERILLRHLGGTYDYEKFADCYVIDFREAPSHEARALVERIATAVAEFLFGNGSTAPEPMAGRGKFDAFAHGGRSAMAGIGDAFGRMFRSIGTLMAVKERAQTAAARTALAPVRPKAKARPARAGAPFDPADLEEEETPDDPAWATSRTAAQTAAPIARRGVFNADAQVAESPLAQRAAIKPRGADLAAAELTPPELAKVAGGPPHQPAPVLLDGSAQSAALQELAKRAAKNESPNLRPVAPAGPKPAMPTPAMPTHASPVVRPSLTPTSATAAGTPPATDSAAALAAGPAAKKAATRAPAVAKPAPPTATTVDKLSFVYRPIWSLRTNMLAISGCYAAGTLPNGELAIGEAVLPPAATLEVIEKVDRAALTHVMEHCLPQMESGRGALIAVPVHYETLLDRERRTAYLNVCRGLSATARKRLIFECRNIDGEPNHGALVSTLMQLKPFATMLIGMLPLQTSNFALWKRAGLGSVAIDASASPGSESEVIDGMHRFALNASQSGLRATACNLGTLSLAAAAVSAGFDFIEGGVIQNQLRPSDVRPFTLEDLYLQYAVARRAKVGPARLLDAADEAP
ncbi:MAG TPA: hypothetical protein VGO34_10135 [Alphaproteobacteria bacterium]|jgi:hypothetical protein